MSPKMGLSRETSGNQKEERMLGPLYDALVHIGRGRGLADYQNADLPALRAMLDRYGIARALALSFASQELDVTYGNNLLFKAVAHEPRLIPCPAVLPDSGLEVGDEGKFIDGLIRKGARGVCLFPQICKTSLDRRVIGPLLRAIEERRLLLMLFETSMLDAATLANEYPGIPILIHRPAYRERTLLPALKQARNLHISIAPYFSPFRGLEVLAAQGLADQIVFASGFPFAEPGAAVAYLAYSALPEEVVEKIACRNLLRLLTGVRLRTGTGRGQDRVSLPSGDEQERIRERRVGGVCRSVWQREPIHWKDITDMHSHYGHWIEFPIWCDSSDALVAEMDRVGIARAMLSHQACVTPNVVWGNNQLLAAMKRYPNRILGYATCYPVNERLGIQEIKRCVNRGMRGIKMHYASSIPYTAAGYKAVWEFADRCRLPVLLHTWDDLNDMEPLFKRYQHTPILLGHSGAGNPARYVECAKKYKNLFLEIVLSAAPYGLVEYFVREVGAERVLFGADAPWMAFGQPLARVLFANITDRQKKMILIENPKRILRD